jgi:hypothetical protein
MILDDWESEAKGMVRVRKLLLQRSPEHRAYIGLVVTSRLNPGAQWYIGSSLSREGVVNTGEQLVFKTSRRASCWNTEIGQKLKLRHIYDKSHSHSIRDLSQRRPLKRQRKWL